MVCVCGEGNIVSEAYKENSASLFSLKKNKEPVIEGSVDLPDLSLFLKFICQTMFI